MRPQQATHTAEYGQPGDVIGFDFDRRLAQDGGMKPPEKFVLINYGIIIAGMVAIYFVVVWLT